MNKSLLFGAAAGLAAGGLLTPAAPHLWLPMKPAIIRQAEKLTHRTAPLLPASMLINPFAFSTSVITLQYTDSQINTTNGTTGAVTVNIGSAHADRVVYLMCHANRASGTNTAPTITVDGNSPTQHVQSISGVYCVTCVSIAVAAGTTVSVSQTYTNSQTNFSVHAWISTKTGLSLFDSLASTHTTTTDTFSDIDCKAGGFILVATSHGSTNAETSAVYTGVDTMAHDFNGTAESPVRNDAHSVVTTETVSTNDFTITYSASGAGTGVAVSFQP